MKLGHTDILFIIKEVFKTFFSLAHSEHTYTTHVVKITQSDQLSKTCGFPFKTASQVPSSHVVCPCQDDTLGLSATQRQRNTCCRIWQTPFFPGVRGLYLLCRSEWCIRPLFRLVGSVLYLLL